MRPDVGVIRLVDDRTGREVTLRCERDRRLVALPPEPRERVDEPRARHVEGLGLLAESDLDALRRRL